MNRKSAANPNFDPDNDARYCRPTSWRNAKQAFGNQYSLATLMRMLEREAHCPRLALAVAIFDFLGKSQSARDAAGDEFFGWLDECQSETSAGRHV